MDSQRLALKSTSEREFERSMAKSEILQHLLQGYGVDGSSVASCVFTSRKFQHALRFSKHPERQFCREPMGLADAAQSRQVIWLYWDFQMSSHE